MRIYLDMDNTMADFSLTIGEAQALVSMHTQGFFANLAPIEGASACVKALQRLGYEVFILSACIDSPYVAQEKVNWVSRHLPTIAPSNIVLVAVGVNKAEVVHAKGAVLVDDYGKNLRDWKNAGGLAVRFDATRRKPHAIHKLEDLPDYILNNLTD